MVDRTLDMSSPHENACPPVPWEWEPGFDTACSVADGWLLHEMTAADQTTDRPEDGVPASTSSRRAFIALSFVLLLGVRTIFFDQSTLGNVPVASSLGSFSLRASQGMIKQAMDRVRNLTGVAHTKENPTVAGSDQDVPITVKPASTLGQTTTASTAAGKRRIFPPTTTPKPSLVAEPVTKPVTRSKRVIAYSMYGSKPMYLRGMVQNARLAKVIYPGWEVWVYHDSTNTTLLDELRSHGAKLIDMKGSRVPKMQWRFLTMNDRSVERFISRDTDSRLTLREKAAVDEWVKSGKPYHTMRDHPQHGVFLLGGMFGMAKTPASLNVEKEILKFSTSNAKQVDQNFLNGPFRKFIKTADVFQHDAFLCQRFPGSIGFPTERDISTWDHVGSAHVAELGPNDLSSVTRKIAPIQCRRNASWIHGRR